MPATKLGHIISAVFRYSAPISQLLIRKFWGFYYQKVHFSCLFCGILIFDIDELGHIISAIFRYSAPISQLLIRKLCFVVPKGKVSVSCFQSISGALCPVGYVGSGSVNSRLPFRVFNKVNFWSVDCFRNSCQKRPNF